ncbi:AraC family transcriptional regulator of arabinose operon [Paenibacillus anaericanus]|uniref:helix-turn-helix transcriptional regulator n=1 Tax=Paenibacillus anaericanus TaxID=170367 RepID=UPI0027844F4B|nr:AraC family transcriptional regulator [Paenibacillus anaericanus]MDQ0089533.1 AraC family transcriptional regulator of arabinose operon [Paenibacillus anaericanus]
MDFDLEVILCDYSIHKNPFQMNMSKGTDSYIFRFQAEGSSQVVLESGTYQLYPGDLLLLRPGDLYDLRINMGPNGSGTSADYYVFCNGTWLDRWWGQVNRPQLSRVSDEGRLRELWHQLVLEKRRLDGGSTELKVTLLQALCYLIDRAVSEVSEPSSISAYHALRIKHYLESYATSSIELEQIAKHVGLSISRVMGVFKQEYGMSILQYVHKLRLSLAMDLMKSSPMTLEQIAEASGFGSYTYFNRIFRNYYEVSPGTYRKGLYD